MSYIHIHNRKAQCIPYNIPGMDLQIAKLSLKLFPNNIVNYHWHKDIEYVMILEGQMQCIVNTKKYLLKPGLGIIINSNQIHSFQKSEAEDCLFLSMLIPLNFAEEYEQLITSCFLDTLLLNRKNPWQSRILDIFPQLHDLAITRPPSFQLRFKSVFYHMWAEISDNMPPACNSQKPDPHIEILKKMITFIHENYNHTISLADIAVSGNVSKSVCCRIFNTHLFQTPFGYLMNYRIQCSIPLLLKKQMSITQIASETGFSNSSYFSEVFKRFIKMSPSEFSKSYLS